MFHFQKKGRLMKPKIFSGYLSSAFYIALLSIALPLSAEEAKEVEIHLSEVELQEIFSNPTRAYVYVGRETSNIADVMQEISKFDDNANSLIHGLTNHIQKGFAIGNYDAVAQALEEAELMLQKNWEKLGEEKASALSRSLDFIIEQVIEERLNLDAELLAFLKNSTQAEQSTDTRSCCPPKPHCHGLRLLIIKEKLDVLGKAKFREDVTFKDDVKFEDEVVFEDAVTFESTISVSDEVIACDLTVGCNINMNNSTSAAVGNINKGGARFMHNFGTNATFLGANAGNFTQTGTNNTGLGTNALSANSTGAANTAVGAAALASNTLGTQNTATGSGALAANTTGVNNVAIGFGALNLNVTGTNNTAVGTNALTSNLVDSNTAVGAFALTSNTTGIDNTAVGYHALQVNTIGTDNTAIGLGSLAANTVGSSNTAVGSDTLTSNTIGASNTALGDDVLSANTIGSSNTAVGTSALTLNTTGSGNTAVGDTALGVNTVGSNNIALGASAGSALTTGNNNIDIGNLGVAAESDTTRIGTTQTRTFVAGVSGVTTAGAAVAVLVDGSGQLGTISSSATRKHNIHNMNRASENIYKLRPVTFAFNGDTTESMQYGLIAEEVYKVFPEIVVNDANGRPASVQYHVLPALLLNEVQKLATRVAALEARA
jgi:hypothetical protein